MSEPGAPDQAALNNSTHAPPVGLSVAAYDAGDGVMIEAVKQRQGPALWAVRFMGDVLNKLGEWESEPQPSNRDAAFLARCRFSTPNEAHDCLKAARKGDLGQA